MQVFNDKLNAIYNDLEKDHYEWTAVKKNAKEEATLISIPHGFYQNHFKTRLTNIVCVPIELTASFQNMISLPVQVLGAFVKYTAVKPLRCVFPKTLKLQKFDEELPGIGKITAAFARAIGYFIGTFITLTLGSLSPRANLWLHKKFKLYSDQNIIKIRTELNAFAKKQLHLEEIRTAAKKLNKKSVQDHIQNKIKEHDERLFNNASAEYLEEKRELEELRKVNEAAEQKAKAEQLEKEKKAKIEEYERAKNEIAQLKRFK